MDIDIDFPPTFAPQQIFKQAIPASMVKDNILTKHSCGYYFQTIPVDSITSLAAIPYEEAEILKYFKIDFLHLSLLEHFSSKQELRELLKQEPDWDLLLDPTVVEKLFQLSKHHSLLVQTHPRSVIELSDTVALIRPGKRHLLQQYLSNRDHIRPMLYRQTGDNKSSFKKSHSIAYSLTIVLQLLLIAQGRL